MKHLMIAFALVGATASASAFAAPNTSLNQQPASIAAQVASNTVSTAYQAGQWVPPYGQPVAGKTRAQVYKELVQAEKDGQLAYLDSTIYAH
jgi:hypothetical protein